MIMCSTLKGKQHVMAVNRSSLLSVFFSVRDREYKPENSTMHQRPTLGLTNIEQEGHGFALTKPVKKTKMVPNRQKCNPQADTSNSQNRHHVRSEKYCRQLRNHAF